MINRAVLQRAFDVVDYLRSRGVDAVIAGGCARDIFFGVKPKDIDIIVTGCTMSDMEYFLGEEDIDVISFHMYRGDCPSDRIIGGFKLVGSDIDIVLYHTETVSEAIDAFDFNLNQFVIKESWRGVDRAYVRFVGKHHWGKLVAVREDTSAERRGRMFDKYIDLIPRRATGEMHFEAPVGGVDGPF